MDRSVNPGVDIEISGMFWTNVLVLLSSPEVVFTALNLMYVVTTQWLVPSCNLHWAGV
jgi:hypothetical protein